MSSASKKESPPQGKLGLVDAIGIIVGIVIGTSIFMAPVMIFSSTPNPESALLVWVVGGLLALIGAFCYAELGTMYPKAGGDYFYFTRAFGPGTGFLFGWAQLVVMMPAAIGTMAVTFAHFLKLALLSKGKVLEFYIQIGDDTRIVDPDFAICCYVVGVLTLINILGVILGKTLQNLLALAKIAGVIAIIVAGFGWPQEGAWTYSEKGTTLLGWGSLALILVMYAYGGWNDAAFVAAEVRQPQRNIPRALIAGVGIITLLYVLVNIAYINGLGFDRVHIEDPRHWGDINPPLQVLKETQYGDHAALAMAIIIMVSALGAANGLIFTGPRVYAALGADHRLFGWIGHWKPGRGAPVMALLLQAVLTVVIIGAITTEHGHTIVSSGLDAINDQFLPPINEYLDQLDRELPPLPYNKEWEPGSGFRALVDRTSPVFWFFFMLTGIALFVLREKDKAQPRPYSTPWYPLVPLLFIASCGWMLYQSTDWAGWSCGLVVALVLAGIPLYWLSYLMTPGKKGPIDLGLPRHSPTSPMETRLR